MHALWETDARLYLAPVVALSGLTLFLSGLRRGFIALRLPVDASGKNLQLMTGFRLLLVGAALVGIAAGWLWHIEALFASAVIIGGGELIETSVNVWALRHQSHQARPQ